ncbi:MAG: Lrp/AsnC family transcriptional regulator [Pseudomonadota bacterium]
MDDTDKSIITVLQDRGKISAQDLAEAAGVASAATSWRRLKSLEEAGYVLGYRAILDRQKLGFKVCAFVHLSIERQYKTIIEEIEAKILERPEVLECYATTGDSDFTLRVIAKDIDDYDRFLQKFLFELPGVSQIRTSIALRELKQTTKIPV